MLDTKTFWELEAENGNQFARLQLKKYGCGLAFNKRPNGDRAGGIRGKLCIEGQLCPICSANVQEKKDD
jgi:hypothetical protein